jgi:hypothetical protein
MEDGQTQLLAVPIPTAAIHWFLLTLGLAPRPTAP